MYNIRLAIKPSAPNIYNLVAKVGTSSSPSGKCLNFGYPPLIPPATAAKIAPGPIAKTVTVTATPSRWLSTDVEGPQRKSIENHWQAKMAVAAR